MSTVSQVVTRNGLTLSAAAITTFCYVLLNAVGLFVLGGRARGVEVLIFVAPVLALPFFLSFIWSVSVASILLWADFVVLHVGYLLNDWPHVSTLITALQSDWPLLLVAILMQIVAAREQKHSCTPL